MNKHSLYWQDLSRHGFFYYTALLFCYCAMFACEVFFVPYYMEVGFSNAQIGVIMALRSAAATLFPPLSAHLRIKSAPSVGRSHCACCS